ncbi:MAG: YcxB family protein [Chitinophagaceae bacterium]
MTISFGYEKKQVLQALRYHFLTRPEIRILLILVNVFAILSAILFAFKKIQPLPFLFFSVLWFILILVIWKILPGSIYRKAMTFKDHFTMQFLDNEVRLENERGVKAWEYSVFSKFVESPNFFHLYFDSRSFFLVPKDAFRDITDMQDTRKLLKEKIR